MTPKKRATGRPSKLTDDVIRRVAQLRREGYAPLAVATFIGVNPATLSRWRAKGRDDLAADLRSPFARFEQAMILRSRAKAVPREPHEPPQPTWDVGRLTPEERDVFTRLLAKAMGAPTLRPPTTRGAKAR